tara:strand:- start:248 stop:1222 length:975 start_codon:yes stop_codon:yes gene_type:complete
MHLLLLRRKEKKGILCLNHKEYFHDFVNEFISSVADNYFVLLHVGGYIQVPKKAEYITYILLPDSRCMESFHIPYTSRAFTPEFFFRQPGNDRTIDFLCVSRAIELKNVAKVLEYFDKSNFNFTYIILKQHLKDPYYLKIIRKKYSSNIRIIDTHHLSSRAYLGLSHKEVSLYYKNARVFIQSSLSEGESRTIHEAFCSGCIIMSHEDMRGGGNDFFNNDNFILYNFNNFQSKLSEAYNKSFSYKKIPSLYENFLEKYSIPRFKKLLYSNLKNLSCFGWDTSLLSLKLPGHYFKVPWYRKGELTSDISSEDQLTQFKNMHNFCD